MHWNDESLNNFFLSSFIFTMATTAVKAGASCRKGEIAWGQGARN
jgi:hypothetical protein